MCFTPQASIITAFVEFGIAIYLLRTIKKKKLIMLPIFVLFLGIYQLTEFMICTSSQPIIWAKIGFVVYTFLPMFLTHIGINLANKKVNKYLYGIPLLFTLIAAFYPDFISQTSCNLFYVSVGTYILTQNKILMSVYLIYYAALPLYGFYEYTKHTRYKFVNNTKLKLGLALIPIALVLSQIYYLIWAIKISAASDSWILISAMIILLTILIIAISAITTKNKEYLGKALPISLFSSAITALILYWLFPVISLDYSSIYCQFALLYTVTIFYLFKFNN